jgi:catechol 2,3-dioxygenase-like lactoylglutathione lyase family enzyme
MHLVSVRLLVSDFDGCFRFYRDIMQFQPDWGEEGSTYASFRTTPGAALSLFRRDHMAEAIGTADLPSVTQCQDRAALIFLVTDIEAEVKELRSRGAQFLSDPRDFPDWTIRAAYLRDPDGNLIELFSPLGESQWTRRVAEEAEKYRRQYDTSA